MEKINNQVNSLTGFRALAAGLVLYYHMLENSKIVETFWIIKYGFAGVNLFFVLSGFLFTTIYYDKIGTEKAPLKDYFLKRIFRVYPVYFFILFLQVFTTGYNNLGDIISHVTMTHGFFKSYRTSVSIPMWTLSVEESFYFLLPGILLLCLKIEHAIANKKKYVKLLVFSLIISFITFALLGIGYLILMVKGDDVGWWTGTIFGRFSDFGIGILAGFWVMKYPNSELLKNRFYSSLLGVIGIIIFIGVSYIIETNGGQSGENVQSLDVRLARKLYAVGAGFFILSISGNSWIKPLFENKVAVYLGKISFTLYLFQYISIGSIHVWVTWQMKSHMLAGWSESVSAIFTTLTIVFISAVIYHTIEMPFQSYLRERFLSKPKRSSISEAKSVTA